MNNLKISNTVNWGHRIVYGTTLFVAIASVCSVLSLMGNIFSPKEIVFFSLGASVLLTPYISPTAKDIVDDLNPKWIYLVAIVLFALMFRSEPFYWIYGGQDQGVYASMSAHFQRGGDIFIADGFDEDVNNKEFRELYYNSLRLENYQPGVYYGGQEDYVFQFYHLHPLWMAIFGDLFGDTARFFSLTFFALLSIIGLYLLTFEITRSAKAAALLGFLMAIQPLHIFFSKWAVTEIVTLALTRLGLYMLMRAIRLYRSGKPKIKLPIIFAGIVFSLYFFTRMSGFIFLPFLLFLVVGGFYYRKKGDLLTATPILLFSLTCLVCYSLSVVYGLIYSYPYCYDIYDETFKRLFGKSYHITGIVFLIVATAIIVGWIAIPAKRLTGIIANEKNVIKYLTIAAAAVVGLAFMAGVYKYISSSIINTNAYVTLEYIQGNILKSNVLNWIIFVSPFLFIYSLSQFKRLKFSPLHLTFIVFLVAPLIYVFYLQWASYYKYYYSRYLLSEAVPYSMVFFIYLMQNAPSKKRIKQLVVGGTLVLFGYYAVVQLGVREGSKNHETLTKIADNIEENDIVLFNIDNWRNTPHMFFTPLRFYFNLNLFSVQEKDLNDLLKRLIKEDGNIYIISPVALPELNFDYKKYITYDNVMERDLSIPDEVVEQIFYEQILVYKVPALQFSLEKEERIVRRKYEQYLKRLPDPVFAIGWMEGLKFYNLTEKDIAKGLLLSEEYRQEFLAGGRMDAREIVEVIYTDVFMNEPKPVQVNFFLRYLSDPSDIETLVEQITNLRYDEPFVPPLPE